MQSSHQEIPEISPSNDDIADEAYHLGLCHTIVKDDSLCSIRGESQKCNPSWELSNAVEEVLDLARMFMASFYHVKRSANSMADSLAKGGVSYNSLITNQSAFPFI